MLSLDVPLVTYLPEPLPDARMKEITAQMVLTHTTGLQNEVSHTAAGTVRPRRKPTEAALPMLHTTTADYARFVIATMKGTGLKRSTARAMLTPQVSLGSLSWGLGWGLQRTSRGDAFWHWGENNGEIQNYAVGSRDGSGVVIFTNSAPGTASARLTPRAATRSRPS